MKRHTKEGNSTWGCGFGLLTTGEGSVAKAYDYINAFLGAKSANYMVDALGYGHTIKVGPCRFLQVAGGARCNRKKT